MELNGDNDIRDIKDKIYEMSCSNDNIKKNLNFKRSNTKPLQLSKLNSSVVKDLEQPQYLETDLNVENSNDRSNKKIKNVLSNNISNRKINLFQSPLNSRNSLNFKDNKTNPNLFLMSFQKKSDTQNKIKPLLNLNKSQVQDKANQSSEKNKINLTNIMEDKTKLVLKDRKLKIKLNRNMMSNGFYKSEFQKFCDNNNKELNKSSVDLPRKDTSRAKITKKESTDLLHPETHQHNSFLSTNSNDNITLQKLKNSIHGKNSDSIIRKSKSLKEKNNELIFNKNSVSFDSNLLEDGNQQLKGKLSSEKQPQSHLVKPRLTPEEGIEDIHFAFVKYIKKSKNITKMQEIKGMTKPGLEYNTVVEFGEINIDDNFN